MRKMLCEATPYEEDVCEIVSERGGAFSPRKCVDSSLVQEGTRPSKPPEVHVGQWVAVKNTLRRRGSSVTPLVTLTCREMMRDIILAALP